MTDYAFEIFGQDRPSRWLVTCDHASNRVPDAIAKAGLGIAECDMERHIAYDLGAAGLARALAERLDAPAILTRFSRLVIDPNRGEDDPTLVMQLYDGTVIPANRNATEAEVERRLALLYRPYHRALAAQAARQADTVILAIHSFTPSLRGRPPRPWQVGVLYSHLDPTPVAAADCPAAGRPEGGVRDFDVNPWWGIFGPAGLSPSIVSKINADISEILKDPDALEVLAKQGGTPLVSSPEAFRDLLAKDIAKWAKTVKAAGIKPN